MKLYIIILYQGSIENGILKIFSLLAVFLILVSIYNISNLWPVKIMLNVFNTRCLVVLLFLLWFIQFK